MAIVLPGSAGVAELVDARDLKSLGSKGPCRFDSGLRHQSNQKVNKDSVPDGSRVLVGWFWHRVAGGWKRFAVAKRSLPASHPERVR